MKKIRIENNVPELDVSVDRDDKGIVISIKKKAQGIRLGDVTCGKIVTIGKRKYIVVGHGEGTTALFGAEEFCRMEFGEDTDYRYSKPRKYLNDDFLKEVADVVGMENIVKHKVKLEANDGTNKGVICYDHVSLITTELYRRYREYIPASGKWFWTATKDSDVSVRSVCVVSNDGSLNWYVCGNCCGVRPFLILNSSILILEDE